MIETERAVHLHRPLPSQAVPSVAGFRRSLLDHFGIDSDIDIVTDDHTAVVQGGIPLYAEVLAIDFCRGACRGSLIALGIFHRSRRALIVYHDSLSGAAYSVSLDDAFRSGPGLALRRGWPAEPT